MEILLDAGADVNAQGGIYGSSLEAALRGGNYNIAQILRDHGAHENVRGLEKDEGNDKRDGLQQETQRNLRATSSVLRDGN